MHIALDHLRVEMPGHRALDDVSSEIPSGTVTAVIGPSGAGKSSLLGVAAGLIRPDSGTVRFDGVDVTASAPEARRLGVVFQELRLFDFLSGRDNVGFGPRMEGASAAEVRSRVDEALELVRATAFAERSVRVLSGGERQRIAIARALAARPRALLLDEPFAALDADLRRSLREELRALVKRLGWTVLLVTHDRDDAFALASRFIVLHQGRVEQAGDAASLYETPASEFVATLLGEATILPVSERRDDRALVCGEWIAVTGQGARVVLRPEAFEVATSGPGWAASLVDARFAGSGWRLVVQLADGARIVAVTAAAPLAQALFVRLRAAAHTL